MANAVVMTDERDVTAGLLLVLYIDGMVQALFGGAEAF